MTIRTFLIVISFPILIFFFSNSVHASVYYIHSDNLGSTSLVTDSRGEKVSQEVYYPYGNTRNVQGNQVTERQYTGQVSDQDLTGLYYYNARYYNPSIAKFTQADTANDGLNRYAYVGNNPINLTDPTGNMMDPGEGGNCDIFTCSPWELKELHNGRAGTNWQSQRVQAQANKRFFEGTVEPIALALPGIVFEPYDWAMTFAKWIGGDYTNWGYDVAGLLPIIPGGARIIGNIQLNKLLENIPIEQLVRYSSQDLSTLNRILNVYNKSPILQGLTNFYKKSNHSNDDYVRAIIAIQNLTTEKFGTTFRIATENELLAEIVSSSNHMSILENTNEIIIHPSYLGTKPAQFLDSLRHEIGALHLVNEFGSKSNLPSFPGWRSQHGTHLLDDISRYGVEGVFRIINTVNQFSP